MSTRETFRPLTDYEGLYEISDRGRVKSLARTVTQTTNGTTFTRFFKERFLKPTPNSHGYYQFKPCRNGKTITLKLAREVAFHFLWNPDSKPEVNHVNGDKTNNSAENLEWATSIEQNQHALATGLRGMPKGTKHWNTSLNERKFPVFFVYSGGGILASGSGSGLLFQISLSDTLTNVDSGSMCPIYGVKLPDVPVVSAVVDV